MQVKTRTLQNFIGGKFVDSEGETIDIINPSTGEGFAQAPLSTQAEIDAAFKAAADAFPGWRDRTPSERSLALLKIADSISANAERLVQIESENTGQPFELTMSEEIPPSVDQVRFFAGAARILECRSAGGDMAEHTTTF